MRTDKNAKYQEHQQVLYVLAVYAGFEAGTDWSDTVQRHDGWRLIVRQETGTRAEVPVIRLKLFKFTDNTFWHSTNFRRQRTVLLSNYQQDPAAHLRRLMEWLTTAMAEWDTRVAECEVKARRESRIGALQ